MLSLVVMSVVLSSCSAARTDERDSALSALGQAEQQIEDLSQQVDQYRARAETAEARAATAEAAVADLELEPTRRPQDYDFLSGRDTIEVPFLMVEPSRETLTVAVRLPSEAEFDHSIRVPGGRTVGKGRFAAGEQPCIPDNEDLTCTVDLPAIPEKPGLWWLVLTKTSESPATLTVVLTSESTD